MTSLGLYVHIPFCPRRCPYCGFAVVTGRDDLQSRYVEAVCAELAHRGEAIGVSFDTIFFGGGTPSRMAPELLAQILSAAAACHPISTNAEVTVEANPTEVDAEGFVALAEIGVTRLSLGVQSFCDHVLLALGRGHTAADGERAYLAARDAGFGNVNLDIMFSVPGTTLTEWRHTLERTTELAPDHVSAYALTIEDGTPFAARRQRGALPTVGEDDDAEAYRLTGELLGGRGYEHYEVSNFALAGKRCRHNWSCWMGGQYMGVGLAAHSYLHGRRTWNVGDLLAYLERVEEDGSAEAGGETIDEQTALLERVWLQLRTRDGVRLSPVERSHLVADERVRGLLGNGVLQLTGDALLLSEDGYAVADAVGLVVSNGLETLYAGQGADLAPVAVGGLR